MTEGHRMEIALPSLAGPLAGRWRDQSRLGPQAGRLNSDKSPFIRPAHLNLARQSTIFLAIISTLWIGSLAWADAPSTQPVVDSATIDAALGITGSVHDGVYCIEVPRKDIHLTIDGAEVPTAAGIASHFYFYTCPCGKTRVIGEFVVCDYESDDVVDALREGWLIKVDAISPMLNDEEPRMRIVRFHGEGSADAIAKHIRAALDQTGDARTK